jgi:hypothetical protein
MDRDMYRRGYLCALLFATLSVACRETPPTEPLQTDVTLETAGPAVLVGVGDVTSCLHSYDDATARILDGVPGTVITLGDNAYPNGSAQDFKDCYAPTWGRHLDRTRPVAGDRDYRVAGAAGYFGYFGDRAGDPTQGYYSYSAGTWRVIVLNSNIARGASSPQVQWLAEQLRSAGSQCVVAMWHHPRFTSTLLSSTNASVRPFWDTLYHYGADLVVNGHDYVYERFAPMRPDGVRDTEFGIRQITVGTGGAALYPLGGAHPNSEIRNGAVRGVVKLTLEADGYRWQFLKVPGLLSFSDVGSASCHDSPNALPTEPAVLAVAGNVTRCSSTPMARAEETAQLLDAISGTVVALGDMVIPGGSDSAFVNCYGPNWGRHLDRTYAVLGNHEYDTGSADAAFNYFGERAGPRDLGYHSFDLGNWHVVVLNDNASYVPYAAGSTQDQWLQADLAANTKPCVVAMWHTPLFLSSNSQGYTVNPTRRTLWERLHAAGADLVLNGQQHHYERMAPMRPDGTVDEATGIRQFNVGTGGESAAMPTVAIHPSSEVRAIDYGVLQVTLGADGYEWRYRPIGGSSFTDTGSGTCH